jgi:hypothetical protein
MEIGRTNPFLLQIQRAWGAIEILYTGNTASTWRLSLLTIAPSRMANRAPSSLGTFSVSGEGKGIVPPGTGSPTLTGRASARYDRAVLIAAPSGPRREGSAERRVAQGNPRFPVSARGRSARYPNPEEVGGVLRASYRIRIGWAHNDASQQALSPCDGDCLWGAPSFPTRK